MAVKLWGSMLEGVSQGFANYQQGQEDLAYTRQTRVNQLAQQQLSNQAQQLANQQQQQVLQDAQNTAQYAREAAQPGNAASTQQGQAAAGRAAPNAPSPTGTPAWKPGGAYSTDDYKRWDAKFNLAPGTSYGLFQTESGANPDAVNKKSGAVGAGQVLPSTAADPGFGLGKGNDPKNPEFALGYFQKLLQKAGGDYSKAFAMYNAGPNGNANNPETQAYVPKALGFQRQYQDHQQASDAATNTTPSDAITARQNAGIPVKLTDMSAALGAQGRLADQYDRMSQAAAQKGDMALAGKFAQTADKMREQQVDLQKKTLDTQKEANEETNKLVIGVKDQDSYNNFQAQLQQNPAMRATVAGLGLTGDYEQDRNKLQTVADRTLTLKDQQELAFKRQDMQIKQAEEQRKQAQADAPKQAQAQAQLQDDKRRTSLTAQGIPFAPSIASTAPAGTSVQQVQQAQAKVDANNAAWDKNNAPAVEGAKNLKSLAAQAYVMVDPKQGNLSTGGAINTFQDSTAPWMLNAKQQEFNKLTNTMVQEMQRMAGANGGARSASTAAMYKNFANAKPNVRLSPEANMAVAHGLYVGGAAQTQMNNFLDEYRQSNPGATAQSGVAQWRLYEMALGPQMVYDPATKALVPNMSGIPSYEDGTPNPQFKDYHVFFANGNKF